MLCGDPCRVGQSTPALGCGQKVIADDCGLDISDEGKLFIRFLAYVGRPGDVLFFSKMAMENGVVAGPPVGVVVLKDARVPAKQVISCKEEIKHGRGVGGVVPGWGAVVVD